MNSKDPISVGPDDNRESAAAEDIRRRMAMLPGDEPGSEGGVTDAALLAIVLDRYECFQAGPLSCEENAHVIRCIREAMLWMNRRAGERAKRGVLGRLDRVMKSHCYICGKNPSTCWCCSECGNDKCEHVEEARTVTAIVLTEHPAGRAERILVSGVNWAQYLLKGFIGSEPGGSIDAIIGAPVSERTVTIDGLPAAAVTFRIFEREWRARVDDLYFVVGIQVVERDTFGISKCSVESVTVTPHYPEDERCKVVA